MTKQQQVQALNAEDWKKAPGRKDTTRWCGGHVGREHEPVVSMRPGAHVQACGVRPSLIHPERSTWHCSHNISCADCHKVLDVATAEDCPDRVA